jgi:hypothetical protein
MAVLISLPDDLLFSIMHMLDTYTLLHGFELINKKTQSLVYKFLDKDHCDRVIKKLNRTDLFMHREYLKSLPILRSVNIETIPISDFLINPDPNTRIMKYITEKHDTFLHKYFTRGDPSIESLQMRIKYWIIGMCKRGWLMLTLKDVYDVMSLDYIEYIHHRLFFVILCKKIRKIHGDYEEKLKRVFNRDANKLTSVGMEIIDKLYHLFERTDLSETRRVFVNQCIRKMLIGYQKKRIRTYLEEGDSGYYEDFYDRDHDYCVRVPLRTLKELKRIIVSECIRIPLEMVFFFEDAEDC